MKTKIYTLGQFAKLHKISLKKASIWIYKIMNKAEVMGGRSHGVMWIENDPHHRMGVPENLAGLYPSIPSKAVVKKLIHVVDPTYQPKTKF